MALAGKELGKEVGSWFGPSTAAGAIKRLVGEFEDAGLEVVVAIDSVVYQSDVYAASCTPRGPHAAAAANGSKASGVGASKHHGKKTQHAQKWGDRAVLVLVGIRLGIDGVNPIYYDSVKVCDAFQFGSPVNLTHFTAGSFHLPSISGHRRRSTILILLFRRLPRR
jgi:cysteine protease ATG4